jgi:hypothetical protein
LELGINEYHALQARSHGFGPQQAIDLAKYYLANMDTKLAAREKLIAAQTTVDAETKELQQLEGAVLSDFRDLSLAEFERFHVSTRKSLAQQDSFYVLDVLKNAVGTVGNYYLVYGSVSHERPLNLPGGILSVIAGGMVMANPIVSRLVGNMVARADKRKLVNSGLPTVIENDENLERDYLRLINFANNHQLKQRTEFSDVMARLEVYDANHRYVANTIERRLKDQRRGNRTAIQNMGTAFLVGSTKVASGTIITVAGAKYTRSAPRTNALLFTAGVAYLPGLTWGLVDNIRIQTGNELRRRSQTKQHELSGQILGTRLKQLNQIKDQIKEKI